MNRFLSSKATAFLKKSFVFALLYATLLYTLVRLFFYEFPFTVGEGFELHGKMLLVVWIFIIICKLVFTSIVLVENNAANIQFDKGMFVPVFKGIIVLLLTAAMTYAGWATGTERNNMADSGNNPSDEPVIEKDIIFEQV